ncbi:LmeA family phospholipid-binding protein [Brevibacterium casei]|uniref:LmeA family phospholipid-binding protein n=1 Tax=Brevibacterium casei TaxID=33889 RepID=UPI003701C17B
MTTREYARPRSRRRTLIVSGIVVVLTLIVGAIAADRIVDSLTERRIAEGLTSYGDAEVDVEGFPVLTQLAAGRLDEVRVTAAQATYEGIDFSDVDAKLFDVPTDTSRPVGTVDAEATIPLATIDRLAKEKASLPDGMAFTTDDNGLVLTGSLLGQEVRIGIDTRAEARRILVSATTIQLGSAQVDLSTLPGFLTSAISDIVIDLEALPAGLELTDIEPADDGLRVSLHGSGVMLS